MNYHGSYLLETIEWLGAKVIFPSICVYIPSWKERIPCSFALLKMMFVCNGGICVYLDNQIYFNTHKHVYGYYYVYICIGVCIHIYIYLYVYSPWPMGLPPLPNHRPHPKWRSCGMCYDWRNAWRFHCSSSAWCLGSTKKHGFWVGFHGILVRCCIYTYSILFLVYFDGSSWRCNFHTLRSTRKG